MQLQYTSKVPAHALERGNTIELTYPGSTQVILTGPQRMHVLAAPRLADGRAYVTAQRIGQDENGGWTKPGAIFTLRYDVNEPVERVW